MLTEILVFCEDHSGVIQVFIAACGLIITVIQVAYAITSLAGRIRKNFRIKRMVRQIKAVNNLDYFIVSMDRGDPAQRLRILKEYANGIYGLNTDSAPATDNISCNPKVDYVISVDIEKEYYKRSADDIESIESLYKGLLLFESEFSLSYGFGRYIDYFRETIPELKQRHDGIISEEDSKEIHRLFEYRLSMEKYMNELRNKFPEKRVTKVWRILMRNLRKWLTSIFIYSKNLLNR